MKKEKTLSEKRILDKEVPRVYYLEEDVKQFIKDLKKEVIGKQGILEQDYKEICVGIDNLAGGNLE